MDRLILMRHGKAEARAPSGEDFDRGLTDRGVAESVAMGRTLAALGAAPDLALVSPSARTRQTWACAGEAFPDAPVRFDDDLYHADQELIRDLAEAGGEPGGTVMVVGHNPGLQELVIRLLVEARAPDTVIAQAHGAFPPSTAAVFRFDAAGRPAYEGLHYPARG
jgi:phosphohistidine phosphatase